MNDDVELARVQKREATTIFHTVLFDAAQRWLDNDAASRAAAIAFFATFALIPMSILVLQIATLIVGDAANIGLLKRQLSQVVGADAADVLGSLLSANEARAASSKFPWISTLSLFVAASATFVELRASLNRMMKDSTHATAIRAAPSRFGWAWPLLKARFVSLSVVIGLGFLLVVWLTIDTLLALVYERYLSGASEAIAYATTTVVTLSILLVAFYALIRVLPDGVIAHRAAWRGAAVAVLLFMGGKWMMTASLIHVFNVGVFGAASGLIALLIWIFYAAAVFLFGAQVAAVYDRVLRPTA
jgi:membrane protein